MSQKQHWPFGDEDPVHGVRHGNKVSHATEDPMREAEAESARRMTRFNRLLVGGRAHVRKRGLS